MNQDVERIADRLKHLEEKEKAAKKLKKQAANECKKNEKVRKARQQLRDLAGFTDYFIASLAGERESQEEPKPQAAGAPNRTQKGGEGDQKGARDAHRLMVSGKPIADNSPLLMFVYLAIEHTSIETVYFRK